MGRVHDTRRCAKRRIYIYIFFFLVIFIHHFKLFIFYMCLDQWTQHNQTNIFFLETPRGAPSALFLF